MEAFVSDSHWVSQAEWYWNESRQPLASLVFVGPLLLVYEVGVVWLGPEAVRNGADVWLRGLLQLTGFGQYFLLPVLTVSLLLGWHYLTRRPWRVRAAVFYGMLGECLLLAVVLRMLLELQGGLLAQLACSLPADPAHTPAGVTLRKAISYFGAGIYEELLFRLVLLSLLGWIAARCGLGARLGTAAAVGVASLLFAAAHHVGPEGEPLCWWVFLFRFLAGVFFSVLFVYRGFGIAAGTHAAYDLLVGL